MTVADLKKNAWEYQHLIDGSNVCIEQQTKSFMKKFGVSSYTQTSRPGAHLPYESEPMKRYRNYINRSVEEKGIHPRLILYWDQVWVLLWTPEAQIIWKDPKKQGVQQDRRLFRHTGVFYDLKLIKLINPILNKGGAIVES